MEKKKRYRYVTRFLATTLLFAVTLGVVAFITFPTNNVAVGVISEIKERPMIIVIDPGHGGEDPGASSESGIYEKDLNLTLSLLLSVLLKASGTDVRLTRNDDRMVYDMFDELENYNGRKKAFDLNNRIRFADECNADLLVSIHMNKFFQPQYGGLQVYFSSNDNSSEKFASAVQKSVKEYVAPENDRQIKKATSSIFLLDNIKRSAILIECGFLSNLKDLSDLTEPLYQLDLSTTIMSAISNAFDSKKEPAG